MNGFALWLVRAAMFFAIVALTFHIVPDYIEFSKNLELLISVALFVAISCVMYKGGMLR